jgi:phosphoribosylformylglycinamidine cyclo-ligase
MGLTYRSAGVDIGRGDAFVRMIRGKLSGGEKDNIGPFGGTYDLTGLSLTHPVLVASTDGVGTKLLVARRAGKLDTLGIDLVAMCVNDIVACGATPLFFLDYLAAGELNLEEGSLLIEGIVAGCREAGIPLLGGETAEMPGVYGKGEYELAGFAVGIAERGNLLPADGIGKGDLLVGIASSGIHANGFSLARKALFEGGRYRGDEIPRGLKRPIIEELLVPTRIYARIVDTVLKDHSVKAIAHITGGGLEANIGRCLPPGLTPHIEWKALDTHPVFSVIQRAGSVEEGEMRRTFNLGIGLVVVAEQKEAEKILSSLRSAGERAYLVGTVGGSE